MCSVFCILAAVLLTPDAPLNAGSVITNNLPAGTAIVNINAQQDGSATYSGPGQSLWYQPFNTGGPNQLLAHTVLPGTYGFRVIDASDASAQYPTLTPSQLASLFTGWTWNAPYATDYLVFDGSAATNASVYQLFDGAFSNTNGVDWQTYRDGPEAYAAAVKGGFYNRLRVGPLGRSGKDFLTRYTFSATTTLIFAIPDNILSDNTGGVSILITPEMDTTGPKLFISKSNLEAVSLSWPTNASDFRLQSTPQLLPSAWGDVTVPPTTVGTNRSVVIPASLPNQFFRLWRN